MLYTVGEMAKRLGVAASTLRYYDKEGLLPFVERSSGMPLKDIRAFVTMEGDKTIGERLSLQSLGETGVKLSILNVLCPLRSQDRRCRRNAL